MKKKITKQDVEEAVTAFLKNGGKITKLRPIEDKAQIRLQELEDYERKFISTKEDPKKGTGEWRIKR